MTGQPGDTRYGAPHPGQSDVSRSSDGPGCTPAATGHGTRVGGIGWDHDLARRLFGVRIEHSEEPDPDEQAGELAATNAGTEPGAMPANVSVNARPIVTAGLAKLVELVNQYAAPM